MVALTRVFDGSRNSKVAGPMLEASIASPNVTVGRTEVLTPVAPPAGVTAVVRGAAVSAA